MQGRYPQRLDSNFRTQLQVNKNKLPIETRRGKVKALPNSTTEKTWNLGRTEAVSKPSSIQRHYSKSSAAAPSPTPGISSVPRPKDWERSISHLRSASVDRRPAAMGSKLCGHPKAEEEDDHVKDSGLLKESNSQDTSVQTHSSFKPSSSVTPSGRMSRSSNRASNNSDRIRSASQGLRNLGNTERNEILDDFLSRMAADKYSTEAVFANACYMNSTLQCLANVPWPRETDFNNDFLNEFFSLMKEMKKTDSNVPINPIKFKKHISVLGFRFSTSDQNDAHEFLICLLGRLKKSLNDSKKGNIVEEKFLGKQENVIEFTNCDHTIINVQSFFSVSLPLVTNSRSKHLMNAVDLRECLEHYTKREKVEGEALCLECQKMQSATIETKFKSLPDILILHLKRYELQTMTKLDNQVTFPVNNLNIKENDGTVSFDLFGVCNHFGSLRFGHYTADIKSDFESGNWYSYSDSSVSPLYDFPSSSSLSSSSAYIFFYKRRGSSVKTAQRGIEHMDSSSTQRNRLSNR